MLLTDIRLALRSLIRSPAFTLAALGTLALGIGASTAIFTVFNRVVLAPLPVEQPEQLAHLVVDRGEDGVASDLSYPLYRRYRDELASVSGLAARSPQPVALTVRSEAPAERLAAELVTGNYFTVVGVPMEIGAGFSPDADQPAGAGVMVLSHGLWERSFSGDHSVVGRSVAINGLPVTIVGVARRGFQGLVRGEAVDAWVPVALQPRLNQRSYLEEARISWLTVVGRLKEGADSARLAAELAVLDRRTQEEQGWPAEWHFGVQPLKLGFTWNVAGFTKPLRVLLVVVGLVMLMACANVASLLLVRGAGRRREIAIRLSLGATRGRVVRQLLVENMLLASAACLLGLALAQWITGLLLSFRPVSGSPMAISSAPDGIVLGFALGLSVLTWVIFGLAPAIGATRPDVAPALRGRIPESHTRIFGLRGILVAGQIAISLVLLVGTTMFLRSLQNLQSIDIGYSSRDVILASVDLTDVGATRDPGSAFYSELERRLRGTGTVTDVSLAAVITPYPYGSNWGGTMVFEGYAAGPDETMSFDINTVTGGYFDLLALPLVAGRTFDERDHATSTKVAIINETMARRYWPGRNPVGLHFQPDAQNPAEVIEVIGVARDGKYRDLREESANNVYFPLAQRYRPDMTILVRGSAPTELITRQIREAVDGLAAGLPVYDVRTLRDHIGFATSKDRMVALLVSLFGMLALTLAAVGLYGMIAYQVAQGRREIGIRMALGADWRRVRQLFVWRGLRTTLAGALVGGLLALVSARLVASQLYGVDPSDWRSLAMALLFLGAVVLAASWIPAQRAARVDPNEALRSE